MYEEIELLSNAVHMKSHWTPVDQLLKLGGLNLLLQVINLAHECNFTGRHVEYIKLFVFIQDVIHIKFIYRFDMIKNALEVLNICCVLPKVQVALCEPISKFHDFQNGMPDNEEMDTRDQNDLVGLNIIIKAAEGDLLEPEIQKAALSVIITCVCAPIHRVCIFVPIIKL